MRRAVVVLVALTLAGCGGGDEPVDSPARTGPNVEAFMADLAHIDARLTVKPTPNVVARAKNVCVDRATREFTDAQIIERNRQRWDSPDISVDTTMAQEITRAAEKWLCQ